MIDSLHSPLLESEVWPQQHGLEESLLLPLKSENDPTKSPVPLDYVNRPDDLLITNITQKTSFRYSRT